MNSHLCACASTCAHGPGGESTVLFPYLLQWVGRDAQTPAKVRQVIDELLGFARTLPGQYRSNPNLVETSVQAIVHIIQQLLSLVRRFGSGCCPVIVLLLFIVEQCY